MSRRLGLAALLVGLATVLAACGSTTRVRERDMVVTGPVVSHATAQTKGDDETVRIAVVTHGQASSLYWAVVRSGIDAAARQMQASVSYRSPDVFSVKRMGELIDEAAASKPDGLVVTLPDRALAGPIHRAQAQGIPVVSINSGDDLFRSIGTLAHVSQDDAAAGYQAGQRLVKAGVHHAVCLNLEHGNDALSRRCAEFARAMREGGATARELAVNFDDQTASERLLAGVFRSQRVDGALALSSSGAEAALAALRDVGREGKVTLGTFDLSPEVLRAVEQGRIAFTIDQQPFLQGYLPIVMLANYVRYGIFPSEGRLITTGPHFVTKANAAQALDLVEKRIR